MVDKKDKINELKTHVKEFEAILRSSDSHEERSRLQKEIDAIHAQIKELTSDIKQGKSIAREFETFFLDD